MTIKLVQILTNLQMLTLDWNFRVIPNEKEFLEKVGDLGNKLVEEVEKNKEE